MRRIETCQGLSRCQPAVALSLRIARWRLVASLLERVQQNGARLPILSAAQIRLDD